ncbi:2-oxo acid dehydrogenase subunit E2 [Guggenheimella bovis]
MNKQGRIIKTIPPFNKIFPYLMKRRTDCQVFAKEVIELEPIEEFIRIQNEKGHRLNHLHVFIAAYVRTLALRPYLNRFVLGQKIYARHGIQISMVIKRGLRDDGEETNVKFEFTGKESIIEISETVQKAIEEGMKPEEGAENVDKIVNAIMRLPGFIKSFMVNFLIFLDGSGLLPESVVKVSPFHSSFYLTYLKSIKVPYVYHHLYNVGTTSIFVSIGQAELLPIATPEGVEVKRALEIGYTVDERICDGFYLGKSLKMAKKFLADPNVLLEPLEAIVEDIE